MAPVRGQEIPALCDVERLLGVACELLKVSVKMREGIKCIESLRVQLERHRKDGLKEYPKADVLFFPVIPCRQHHGLTRRAHV